MAEVGGGGEGMLVGRAMEIVGEEEEECIGDKVSGVLLKFHVIPHYHSVLIDLLLLALLHLKIQFYPLSGRRKIV